MILTFILRNDAPMFHCGDSPSYRTVQIALTKEQCDKINIKKTHHHGGEDYYESISKVITEG